MSNFCVASSAYYYTFIGNFIVLLNVIVSDPADDRVRQWVKM